MAQNQNQGEVAVVPLEELRDYLKGLIPKIPKNKKIPKEDERRIDALLEVYIWASEKAGHKIER